jgi:hypothetical protein
MNKIILQLWEESIKNGTFLSSGCTLHLNLKERDKYVDSIYSNRNENSIPNVYDKIIGDPIVVYVNDEMYNNITVEKSIKISQVEFLNMIKFGEIISNEF